jgi:YYY domain-containing protein
MLIHAYIQWWHEIFLLWLLVVAIGFCAFPLMSRIASNLNDRGYAMSKVAGLALLIFFTWMFSHALGYGITAIFLAFSTIALLSIVALKKKPKPFDQTFLKFVEVDLVFTLSFLFFVALQMYHPFIEGGPTTTLYTGERFMGSAFLNAINRASLLPPPDPWLSGYTLQHYYYFGYLMGSILSKLSAIPTNILFNLLTPLCAALTTSITYGLGCNLTGKRRYGLLTALLVAFIGNLHLFKMLLEQLATSPDIVLQHIATKWDYYYWSPTRALFDTNQAITEFPFFSFMWGDFHPHMIGLAFQVLIISLLYAFISNSRSIFGNEKSTAFFSVLVFGISLGFLYANSAWDYPGYAALAILVIGANQLKRGASLARSILSAGLPVAASIFLYLPYILAFKAIGAKGIGIVTYPSPIAGFLLVHGLPLLAIAFFALSQKWTDLAVKKVFLVLLSSIILIPLLLILSILYPVLIFILPIIFFSLLFIFREIRKNTVPREVFFAFCLILGGASILFFSEIFYVMDYLAWGEFQRMCHGLSCLGRIPANEHGVQILQSGMGNVDDFGCFLHLLHAEKSEGKA